MVDFGASGARGAGAGAGRAAAARAGGAAALGGGRAAAVVLGGRGFGLAACALLATAACRAGDGLGAKPPNLAAVPGRDGGLTPAVRGAVAVRGSGAPGLGCGPVPRARVEGGGLAATAPGLGLPAGPTLEGGGFCDPRSLAGGNDEPPGGSLAPAPSVIVLLI